MKKKLSETLELDFSHPFPARFRASGKQFTVLIGIGGNMGNVPRRFKQLLHYLDGYPLIDVSATSPILKNPPFGYLKQPDFYNALLVVKTDLFPLELLKRLLWIEKRFGRVRTFKNAPRTLDLDIIFFELKKVYNKRLTIPHPHWHTRESVLIPLQYLSNRRR